MKRLWPKPHSGSGGRRFHHYTARLNRMVQYVGLGEENTLREPRVRALGLGEFLGEISPDSTQFLAGASAASWSSTLVQRHGQRSALLPCASGPASERPDGPKPKLRAAALRLMP